MLLLGSIDSSGQSTTNSFKVKGVCSMWEQWPMQMRLSIRKLQAIPSIIFKGRKMVASRQRRPFRALQNMPYVYAGIAVYDMLQNKMRLRSFHYLPMADHPAYDNGFCVQQASCFFIRLCWAPLQAANFSGTIPVAHRYFRRIFIM